MRLSELALAIQNPDRYRLFETTPVEKIKNIEIKTIVEAYYRGADEAERIAASVLNGFWTSNRSICLASRTDHQKLINSDSNLAEDDPIRGEGLANNKGTSWNGSVNILSTKLGVITVLAESSRYGSGRGRPGIWLLNNREEFKDIPRFDELDVVHCAMRALVTKTDDVKSVNFDRIKDKRALFDSIVRGLLLKGLGQQESDESSLQLFNLYAESLQPSTPLALHTSDHLSLYRSSYVHSFLQSYFLHPLTSIPVPLQTADKQPEDIDDSAGRQPLVSLKTGTVQEFDPNYAYLYSESFKDWLLGKRGFFEPTVENPAELSILVSEYKDHIDF